MATYLEAHTEHNGILPHIHTYLYMIFFLLNMHVHVFIVPATSLKREKIVDCFLTVLKWVVVRTFYLKLLLYKEHL